MTGLFWCGVGAGGALIAFLGSAHMREPGAAAIAAVLLTIAVHTARVHAKAIRKLERRLEEDDDGDE